MIRIRIKYISILFVIFTVILLSSYSRAEEINLGFNSININTLSSFRLVDLVDSDLNDKDYIIEGPYVITINNIRKNLRMKLNFSSSDWNSYQMITDKIQLQYRVVSSSEKTSWSQWFSLKSLPLLIYFNANENKNNFSERAMIYLQLKVPQSLDIRRGVYQGEFSLEIE